MKTYEAFFKTGSSEIISATDEAEARRRAMVSRYGDRPNAVVPHAPQYNGKGLSVFEVAA